MNTHGLTKTKQKEEKQSTGLGAPTISLPKGGGAIRGMGEKFAANPVTGTGSMTVPIATSPGRSGFGPQLALSYDSGAGNGPFGLGWNLSLPSITRKTDKGLPRYLDGHDQASDSDVFILSGAEDLVPAFKRDAQGNWIRDTQGNLIIHDEPRTINLVTYRVRQYRPRVEGLFARIERWTHTVTGEIHWRSISKDNITTLYGKDNNSRIYDPEDKDPQHPTRIFTWLICQSYDDKGNAIEYQYRTEDGEGVDFALAREANRGIKSDVRRTANRYLDRICYGNVAPYFATEVGDRKKTVWPTVWMFEVAFEYEGEERLTGYTQYASDQREYYRDASTSSTQKWTVRKDACSCYRAGFEVRTNRRCSRTLMFHHFLGELQRGTTPLGQPRSEPDYLVRSTDFTYEYGVEHGSSAVASYLKSVTQRSYQAWNTGPHAGQYYTRALPPVEFDYTVATIDDTIREIDTESLENLPAGLAGSSYRWVDLDGEGISGILTEEGGAWYYKRNLSPLNVQTEKDPSGKPRDVTLAQFGPLECVSSLPSLANLSAGGQQLLDLAGDGELDLVTFDRPMAGFYERSSDDNWAPFVLFQSQPELPWSSPNLRFVDLTGDGHADILITEDDALSWHASLGETGFAPAERVPQALDEEFGPRVVFADGTETIFLADLSGDGLSDLVRIRNGEICYWPNIGYGRFGAKVMMDGSPWFDYPDRFDPRRIRLADIDGSGTTDIIYLHADETRIYYNLAGNAWSEARVLANFPRVDNLANVQVLDLLGNGTACIAWSSPLPGDARSPMRYIDLLGGQKPHLLIRVRNNLGAQTEIQYVPSTRFYLQDKVAGTPWATRLPFPVHCVAKVTVNDKWRGTEFTTTYSYHHGYFDGVEREFRGFGRVEQVDVESYGQFAKANAHSLYITPDQTLWQPPVKSVTWFHTGIAADRGRILGLYEREYFPNRFGEQLAGATFAEKLLSHPTIDKGSANDPDLDADEWREAMRSCKGMALRQEVYELDLAALHERGEHKPVRLYSAAQHNCDIRRLQPKGNNWHAVFLVTEREAISYQYELPLLAAPAKLAPDPRIAHTLNLRFDDYGRAQQSVAVVYPRQTQFTDAALRPEQLKVINEVQNERHLAYTETHFKAHFTKELPVNLDNHRLPAPCEVLTYELTGDDQTNGFSPSGPLYFSVADLTKFTLSDTLANQGTKKVARLDYHQQPTDHSAHKRIIEWVRMRYYKDNLSGARPFLEQPGAEMLGEQSWLGLLYETYKLALTDDLLAAVFSDHDPAGIVLEDRLAWKLEDNADAVRQLLEKPSVSGYVPGSEIDSNLTGQHWIRSGIAVYEPDAPDHFYLPEKYTDPFENDTTFIFDTAYHLYGQSSTDALNNTTTVEAFDFRVLAPSALVDASDNHSEAAFDVHGQVVALAVKGKNVSPDATKEIWEGDDLTGFDLALCNPASMEIQTFCTAKTFNDDKARKLLLRATTRFVYHFGEERDAAGKVTAWAKQMAGACAIQREIHASQPGGTDATLPIQVALECSDGTGTVLMKKSQAEPDPDISGAGIRWIVNGLTVLNNKGKPVKQYEPAFSDDFGFEPPQANGVTPVMFYDAAGRLVRTELPDGTFSRVEFSPWHVKTFDQNDTVMESDWHLTRSQFDPKDSLPIDLATGVSTADPEQRAGWLAARHANTPAITILDSLGRNVIAIARNRVQDAAGTSTFDGRPWKAVADGTRFRDDYYLTYTKLDAEGKPLWIVDALNHLVMQYVHPYAADNRTEPHSFAPCYDIAGNLLFQHSMDGGDRWMLMDAAGKPMLAWDFNEREDAASRFDEKRLYWTEYDALHRPTAVWLRVWDRPTPASAVPTPPAFTAHAQEKIERFEYQDGLPNDVKNLNGQLVRHYDPSGVVENVRRDFKGNVQEVRRTLVADGTVSRVDWQSDVNTSKLLAETETFTQITEHDALNRMTLHYNWHRVGRPVAVYHPSYNQRGALESETLRLHAAKTPDGFDKNSGQLTQAIQDIHYNAKGQKTLLQLGNGTVTQYDYDEKTFRIRQIFTDRPPPTHPFPNYRSNLKDPAVFQQLLYTYDPVGNITAVEDQAYEPVFFQNQKVEARSLYEYDPLYRLISATGRENGALRGAPTNLEDGPVVAQFPIQPTDLNALRNYTQTYRYDAAGNIQRMRHVAGSPGSWTHDYAYAFEDSTQPASNRLWQTWVGGDRSMATTYLHDTHGSMRNLARTAQEYHLRWDHHDMIGSINLGGGGTAYYQYDSGKQRTRKRIERNGTIEERIYLGGFELYRKYKSSDILHPVEEIESHHLFEGKQRVLLVDDVLKTDRKHSNGSAYKTDPLFRYQHSNHLGSTCLELDDQARIISYEEYHSYGTTAYRAMKSGHEAPPKRHRYTGMERDEENGLGYHSARYYAPWLGRWMSCDPIGPNDGINLYAYSRNNPILLKDLTGTVAGVDDAAEAVLVAFAAVVLFAVYWTMPSTQDSIRRDVNDLTKWLSVPNMSPFASPLKGNPESFGPKPQSDNKPVTKTAADPKPDPKPNPKPLGPDLIPPRQPDEKKPKLQLNLDSSAVQSYATQPKALAKLETLALKYDFVITEAALDEALQGISERASGPQILLANALLARAEIIQDDPDESYDKLLLRQNEDPTKDNFVPVGVPLFRKKGDGVDLIILGTAVRRSIPTATSDVTIINRLKNVPGIRQPETIEIPVGSYPSKP